MCTKLTKLTHSFQQCSLFSLFIVSDSIQVFSSIKTSSAVNSVHNDKHCYTTTLFELFETVVRNIEPTLN